MASVYAVFPILTVFFTITLPAFAPQYHPPTVIGPALQRAVNLMTPKWRALAVGMSSGVCSHARPHLVALRLKIFREVQRLRQHLTRRVRRHHEPVPTPIYCSSCVSAACCFSTRQPEIGSEWRGKPPAYPPLFDE